MEDEQELHKRFAHLRTTLEWFRADKELLDYIATVVTTVATSGDGSGRPTTRKLPPQLQLEVEVEEEEDQRSDSAEPTLPGVSAPPFMVFPCSGQPRKWELTRDQVDRWQELFPGLDVAATMRDCLAWQEGAGGKRKTARGMTRFLTNWLVRNQDSGRGPRRSGPGVVESDGGGDLERAARELSGKHGR